MAKIKVHGYTDAKGEPHVFLNGAELFPTKSMSVKKFSLTGFRWGWSYGANQLALAILLEVCETNKDALNKCEELTKKVFRILPIANDFDIQIDLSDYSFQNN